MKNLVLCVASLGVLASVASASVTVNMGDHYGTNGNSTFLIKYNGNFKTVTATPFLANVNGGFEFLAYCVDLDDEAATNSSYQADPSSVLTTLGAAGGKIGYIYNTYGMTTDIDHQIAAQVAIWEVRYDSTFNFSADNFQTVNLNSTVKGYAQAIIDDLTNHPSLSADATYYASLTNSQDVIGPVPEPASLAALSIGALGFFRRRNKRSSK